MPSAEISQLCSPNASQSSADGAHKNNGSGNDVHAALQQPPQAACPRAQAFCSMPEQPRITAAQSAAAKRVHEASAQPPTPVKPNSHSVAPEHEELQPGSAFFGETTASPKAAVSTVEVHNSPNSASIDTDVTQSAKQSNRAERSCHSSDSEQEEQAPRVALQPDEAGVNSQSTQAGVETPRQPDHKARNTAGKMPTPAVTTSRKPTKKAQDEHSAKALHDSAWWTHSLWVQDHTGMIHEIECDS